MIADNRFGNCNQSFWAWVRFISERLGYSKSGSVIVYSAEDIKKLMVQNNIDFSDNDVNILIQYFQYRAEVLNDFFRVNLMTSIDAEEVFQVLKKEYDENGYTCSLPLNKQKGVMRQTAYFTSIINIGAERTIRNFATSNNLTYGVDIGFDDDPRNLVHFIGTDSELKGVMSRRLDGAFPSIRNPMLVWEIKEYYYATTFGSRVADGVYETQLDGYELSLFKQSMNRNIKHVYFIDAYRTWWVQGKSYLCRIIDMLNMGLVDEVIVGREALTRWPDVINEVLYSS